VTSEIKFKRDSALRNYLFTAESFKHPAKMDTQLLIWLVERYSKAGDLILDPMFGVGTTMLACTLGRHVIGIELESSFVTMAENNWVKVSQFPQLGNELGTCVIRQGDARQADYWQDAKPDLIITSPPYAEAQSGGGIAQKGYNGSKHTPSDLLCKTTYMPENIGSDPANIQRLKYGTPYLEAMKDIYKQCLEKLKISGIMILVTKNFVRDHQEIRLDLETIKICESVGFIFKERHYRKLSGVSLFRTIYQQKYPDAPVLDKEDILVFVKSI